MSLGALLPPRNWLRGPHSGKKERLMVSEGATHWLRACLALLNRRRKTERDREEKRMREMTPMGLEDRPTYLR